MRPTVRRAAAGVSLTLALALAVPVASASAAPGHGRKPVPAPAAATQTLHGALQAASQTYRAAARAARTAYRNDPTLVAARAAYRVSLGTATDASDIQAAWDAYVAARATALGTWRSTVGTARAAWVVTSEAAFAAYDAATDPTHAADALAFRTSVLAAYDAAIAGRAAAQATYQTCVAADLAILNAAIFAAHAQYNRSGRTPADLVLLVQAMEHGQQVFRLSPTVIACQRAKKAAERLVRSQRAAAWESARDTYRLAVGAEPRFSAAVIVGTREHI